MTPAPFRIAVVATVYRPDSHADVIVSRWLKPFHTDHLYGWEPKTQIASIYVEQIPENDMAVAKCKEFDVLHAKSIEEALTLGGEELAVDAILLIGEHGDYPVTPYLQKMYPRKELLDAVVDLFRRKGKIVPIFFDKHFSYNTAYAHEMYWTVRDMGIPFFGGSSLPFAGLAPAPLTFEGRPPVKEVVAIYHDSVEAYLYHALEVNESAISEMSGNCGVQSVVAWGGESFWKAVDEGAFSWELLEELTTRLGEKHGSLEAYRKLRAERDDQVAGYQFTGCDGVKTTFVWHRTALPNWAFAVEHEGGEVQVTGVEAAGREHFFGHFANLNRLIQDFFLTGKAPAPLERLYMSTMTTAVSMHALGQAGTPIAVPWINRDVPREMPPNTVPDCPPAFSTWVK